MKITVVRGDVTRQDVEAVVTAANTKLAVAVASTARCTPPPARGCCRPRWRWRPAHRVGR